MHIHFEHQFVIRKYAFFSFCFFSDFSLFFHRQYLSYPSFLWMMELFEYFQVITVTVMHFHIFCDIYALKKNLATNQLSIKVPLRFCLFQNQVMKCRNWKKRRDKWLKKLWMRKLSKTREFCLWGNWFVHLFSVILFYANSDDEITHN